MAAMRLAYAVAAAAAAVWLSATGCGKASESESYCRDYQTVFVSTCTDTCRRKTNGAEACAGHCTALLPQDTTFKAKCTALAPADIGP